MIHVIGEILVDVIMDGDKKDVFPGGAPFNVASNITIFGGKTSFYGAVGKDEYGKLLKKSAKKCKFDQLIIATPKNRDTTVALVTLTDGERDFKFIRSNGADYVLSLSKLKKLNINKGDIVHIGSLMLSEKRGRNFFYKAVKYIKEKEAKISFDVNYREDIFPNSSSAKRIMKKVIKYADYLKFSEDELVLLTGKKTIKGALANLVNNEQHAFVTLGKNGSLSYKNKEITKVKTFEVKPTDTTGAGDAFYSYVLYYLDTNKDNLDIETALLRANVCGAFAVTKKGATGVVPSEKEIDEFLNKQID